MSVETGAAADSAVADALLAALRGVVSKSDVYLIKAAQASTCVTPSQRMMQFVACIGVVLHALKQSCAELQFEAVEGSAQAASRLQHRCQGAAHSPPDQQRRGCSLPHSHAGGPGRSQRLP